jgi:peptidoglycan/LPS O-acetylase OafA/YrhL
MPVERRRRFRAPSAQTPIAGTIGAMTALPDGSSLPPPPAPERLRYIDALRAIAALLVVWLHAATIFANASAETAASGGLFVSIPAYIDVGHIGVVVFFLVSGFVIPFSMLPDRVAPVGSFVIRRFFRIYPAYWLSVPLAALVVFWIWGTPFGMREVLVNLTLMQYAFGVRPAEGVYWTLLVELVFYALCVVLLVSGSLFERGRIAVFAAALGLAFIACYAPYMLKRQFMTTAAPYWFLNLSVMFCGALFRSRHDAKGRDAIADALLAAMIVCYVLVLPAATLIAYGAKYSEPLTYAAGFVIFIAGARAFRIETRLTDGLGRISYSIYLFHVIVFLAIDWWLLRQPAVSPWRTQPIWIYTAVGVAATLLVAGLVYRFVEKPGIRIGHRLAAAWQARATRRMRAPPRGA